MEMSLFFTVCYLKRLCIFPPPPDVLSDFLFKAPDATTGNTASLNWNLGRVSGVSVHYVMCNIALGNKRKEHAQTSFAI